LARALAWAGLVILVTACTPTNPFLVTSEVHVESLSQAVYEPHHGPVVVVKGPLPDGIRYAEIARVWYAAGSYGGAAPVLRKLAARARELGANALIDTHVWFQPAGIGWATPHAEATAVKVLDSDQADDLAELGDVY